MTARRRRWLSPGAVVAAVVVATLAGCLPAEAPPDDGPVVVGRRGTGSGATTGDNGGGGGAPPAPPAPSDPVVIDGDSAATHDGRPLPPPGEGEGEGEGDVGAGGFEEPCFDGGGCVAGLACLDGTCLEPCFTGCPQCTDRYGSCVCDGFDLCAEVTGSGGDGNDTPGDAVDVGFLSSEGSDVLNDRFGSGDFVDYFRVLAPDDGVFSASLRWEGGDNLDVFLLDPNGDELNGEGGAFSGSGRPERLTENVFAEQELLVMVVRQSGPPVDYELTLGVTDNEDRGVLFANPLGVLFAGQTTTAIGELRDLRGDPTFASVILGTQEVDVYELLVGDASPLTISLETFATSSSNEFSLLVWSLPPNEGGDGAIDLVAATPGNPGDTSINVDGDQSVFISVHTASEPDDEGAYVLTLTLQ